MNSQTSSALLVFLFTDLVDSTGWKQALGDRDYAEGLLKPHNDHFRTVLRDFPDAVERNFTGDGFLVTFTSPSQAVQCALRMHEALRTHAWNESVRRHGRIPTTRIGIHLGEAIAYDDLDPAKQQVSGQAVDLAARVMGLALGTQTLLTRHAFDSARQYVRDEGLVWLAHGPYRCKGSDEPLDVCEVGAPGRAPLAPPPDSDKARRMKVDADDDTGAWRPAAGLPIPKRDGWTIEKKLGEGGFGEVWLASHKRTKERRVFKFCFDADRLRSFKRELTFFKLLKNELGDRPDIVKLHEVHVDSPPYFLESEYVEAGNLAQWAESVGGLDKVPFAARLKLLAGIAQAVAAAHSLGIIHKDIKPSNVLIELNKDGEVQPLLSDFGIGVLADRTLLERGAITDTGFTESVMFGNDSSRTGTRLYSPPEANLGKPATTGFDVYALGVMLFQMAAGDLYRPLGTGWQDGVATDDPVQTALLQDDITAATHGEPGKRMASAAMLAERLETLGQHRAECQAMQERERLERLAREREKRLKGLRRLMAASLVVMAGVAALGAYAWMAKNLADSKTLEAEAQEAEAQRQRGLAVQAGDDLKKSLDNETKAKQCAEKAATDLKTSNDDLLAANDKTEHLLANATLTVADSFDEKAQLISAYEQLRSISEKWRGWEWYYRRHHYDNSYYATLYGHKWDVNSVCWSGDGKRIASGSSDNTVRIWDAATGQNLLELKGHTDSVKSVSWSSDSTRLASGSEDSTVRIWDAATGRNLLEINCRTNSQILKRFTSGVLSVSWSSDGKRIASSSWDNTVRIWDAATGKNLLELKRSPNDVSNVSWSGDGTRITTGDGDSMVRIWDAATGKNLLELKGHTWKVNCVCWSGDGKRIASGSWDNTVRIWDATSGQSLLELKGHMKPLRSVCWSGDDKRVASGSEDSTVRIWDAATGQNLLELKGHTDKVNSVSWSGDGRQVASGSHDKTVCIWDTASRQNPLELSKGDMSCVHSVCWSGDSTRVASGSIDETVRVWDAATGQNLLELKGHTNWVNSVSWSVDGKRIASGSDDKTVRIWDAATGQSLLSLKGHASKVTSICLSVDSKRIASGSADNTVRIWDIATGQNLLELKGHTDAVTSVSWSGDGKRIASASGDRTVRIWDAATGQNLLELKGHTWKVNCVCWSGDGKRIASASDDKTVRIWDAATGQNLLELKGHTNGVNSLSWNVDGKRIASGSADNTVRIWDAATGQSLLELKGHTSTVSSVSWSGDGKRIASGSIDRTVLLWDAATGQSLLELKGHTSTVSSVSWSGDGKRIASGSWDKTVRIWDAATGQNHLELKGHTNSVISLCWSGDRKRVASGSNDNTLRIWDAVTGKNFLVLKGHTSGVTSACWSDDGKRIVSGSSDNTLHIWDALTGQLFNKLRGHSKPVTRLSWSRDGKRIASGSMNDKTVRIWDTATGKELEKLQDWPDWAKFPSCFSPDERWFAHCEENIVHIVPMQLTPEQIVYRQTKARFDPFWAEEQAKIAEKANDAFASAFYRAQLAQAAPADSQHWHALIAASEKLGDYRKPLEVCDRLLTRDPHQVPIYRRRAFIRQKALDPVGAWNDLFTAALLSAKK